jgi:hypothetical protein
VVLSSPAELANRLVQGVVVPLGVGPVVVGAVGGGQGVQDGADHGRAFRGQVTGEQAGAGEGGVQAQRAVGRGAGGVGAAGGLGVGLGPDLGGELGQVPQAQAAAGGAGQDRVGVVDAVGGEQVGPLAQGPGVGLRHFPGGQGGQDPGVGAGPAGPAGVPGGGAAGDPGLVHQPGPGAVGPVGGVAFACGEGGQDRGPGRDPDRVGLLQDLQGPGLGRGGHRGRVGGGQVPRRGGQHGQRLAGARGSRGGRGGAGGGRGGAGGGLRALVGADGGSPPCGRAGSWVVLPWCPVAGGTKVPDRERSCVIIIQAVSLF